jgi:flotillin
VAENTAEAEKGRKKAEADERIFVQDQESQAVHGENTANAQIADSNAVLAVKQAAARQQAEVARRNAEAEIQKAQYLAEQQRLRAEEIVRQEVEKQKVEIAAEAEAEKVRREAKGHADGVLLKYEAEAKGMQQVLEGKAAGYTSLVRSCAGDAQAAATFLMIEKIDELVARQVEAIKNIKIDKITVWDSGQAGEQGSSTSGFISSLIKSVPPLHDIAGLAGVDLPDYLGHIKDAPVSANREDPETQAEAASQQGEA